MNARLEKDFLEELKESLKKERDLLLQELSNIAERSPEGRNSNWQAKYENLGDDQDDNALEVSEYATRVTLEQTLENRLKRVNAALEKIEKGEYGICEVGGEPITPERLKANPATTTCLKHTK